MAKVLKIVKTVRNHWKKSIFFTGVVAYGYNYAHERYKINELMRHYCAEASIYGNVTHPATQQFGKVLVILNPTADKKSSADTFEEYCAPILHVGGLDVDVVKTDSEGHARRYVEELEKLPQAILCAGGDGTLFEIVTGLLRRPSRKDDVYPTIGLLPIGRTNLMGENMFNFKTSSKLDRARGLADASIAVVRGKTTRKDLMKIEVIEDQQNIKPVYAFSTFEWGAFRDAFNERDRYWYFGPLRDYVAFVFKAFDNDLSWNCAAELKYTEPCSGCSNCFVKPQQNERKQARRWWSSFIPSFRLGSSQSSNGPDYSKITNTNCAHTNSVQCQSAGILVTASNVECDIDEKAPPKLNIKLIKPTSSFDFVSDSWSRLNSRNISTEAEYAVRSVEIQPETKSEEEKPRYFYIDNESFEVKSIRITLLPKFINFYAPESQ